MGKPAPPNYVAGLGRGAQGFTTRSDIGPARDLTTGDDLNKDITENEANKKQENEEGLLASKPYDRDDEEADRIYGQIEEKMAERRLNKKHKNLAGKVSSIKNDNISESDKSIRNQFSDLRQDLAKVSEEDWANIPEPGDLRAAGRKRKNKQTREYFTPVPDMLLDSVRRKNQMDSNIDSKKIGLEDADEDATTKDFRQISKAKDDLLKARLDQASAQESKVEVSEVDTKNYLADLSSEIIKTDSEIGDIKKARELLRSVVITNPKHGPGWIAAARIEEIDGKLAKARTIISQACEECPKDEDVWMEAARLNKTETAKVILANAVRQIQKSSKIWLKAMELENSIDLKKKIVRKAIEFVPKSEELWRAAVELEDDVDDAKILLSRAVEYVKHSVDMWLALAKLETYENAQKVLNAARRACPNSHDIWVAAARLEESNGSVDKVPLIMKRAVVTLSEKGVGLPREKWLEEAEKCEHWGSPHTCQAIIDAAIGIDIDDEDKKKVWMEDAQNFIRKGSIETSRAIFTHSLQNFPTDPSIWNLAADLERQHGTSESLDSLLKTAVNKCPSSEELWLILAKEKKTRGEVHAARLCLADAFKYKPNSEKIWLAAVNLEIESGELERGKILLSKAREQSGTESIWYNSILLERNLGKKNEAIDMADQALQKYPFCDKFYIIKAKVLEDLDEHESAKQVYVLGTKKCAKSATLWINYANLEEKMKKITRSRALLDKARILNPKEPKIWHESVSLEQRNCNEPQAKAIMAKALLECPKSGLLWSTAIFMEPRPTRKAKSVDALKNCENDPLVVIAVARLFWMERNLDKARTWFERATKIDPQFGDTWAWLYRFEIQHGTKDRLEKVISDCVLAEPNKGIYWEQVAGDSNNWRLKAREVLLKTINLIPIVTK